jgi:hypothetical protein
MLKKVQPQLAAYIDEPPQPLGSIGRELWHRMLGDRDLSSERERELLFQAAVATQRAADLAEQIEKDGLITETATGRKVENAAIRWELHYRAMAVRCLALLKPAGPGSPGRPAGRWYGDADD